jgi:hypothetical protein
MNNQPQIESKNLTNLGDLMNHEANAYAKAKTYVPQLGNADSKNIIEEVQTHRKQSFMALDNYLQSHN